MMETRLCNGSIFQQFVAEISFLLAINWPTIVHYLVIVKHFTLFWYLMLKIICTEKFLLWIFCFHMNTSILFYHFWPWNNIISAISDNFTLTMLSLHNTLCYMITVIFAGTTSETTKIPPNIVPFHFREDLVVGSRTRVTCEGNTCFWLVDTW